MNEEIRQESTGAQSPNVVSKGPVTITYNSKTAIGAAVVVAALAAVVVFLILKDRGEEQERTQKRIETLENRLVEAVRDNPQVEQVVESGQLEAVVYRQIELLADMKSQIKDYEYTDDNGDEVDVLALLDEPDLDEAEKWVEKSYLQTRWDTNQAKRAAAEAFVLGGIESIRFEYDLAKKYYNEAIDRDPRNDLYRSRLGSLELVHGRNRADYQAAIGHFEKALQIRFCALSDRSGDQSDLFESCDVSVAPTAKDPCDPDVATAFGRTGDPEVAGILNDLGRAWDKFRYYPRAVCLYEIALDIRRTADGDQQERIAAILNNIGVALDKTRQHESAREKNDEALNLYALNEIRNWAYANTLHNRGASWYDSEKLGNARKDFSQALEVRTEVLGARHPDTASSLFSLGNIDVALGKNDAALASYRKAYDIFQDTLRPDHPYTRTVESQICRVQSPDNENC